MFYTFMAMSSVGLAAYGFITQTPQWGWWCVMALLFSIGIDSVRDD